MEKHHIPWLFLVIGMVVIIIIVALILVKTNFIAAIWEFVNRASGITSSI